MIQNDSNGGDNLFFFDDSAKELHMTTRELTKKTLSSEDVHIEVSHMFNAEEKFAELKRYVIGTGIGIASLLLAGIGLVISVQQIYGTGQQRVADSRYETIVTKLGAAEEYYRASGERQELFKSSVQNTIAGISGEVKANREMITTVLEQQQRTNASLEKLVAEKQ
ncbi:hypothetical protein ACRTDM_05405 [Shewanella algae]|uniref:hypothetical protein n=1 Tax=Shewanella algae TaxID=38313 RepID=UPI003D7D4443